MNKPLILVVEDDTPVRNLITMTLKTHEYRYLSAQNGASAVMEALSHNPDIVLLDLGLPDMDGVEVIQKIRSWSNMPIKAFFRGRTVGTTAGDAAETVDDENRLRAGFSDFYEWCAENRLCGRLRIS